MKKKKFESPGTSLLTLSLQTNTDFLWVIPKYGPLSPPLGSARSLGPEVGVTPAWCAGEPSTPAAEVVTSPIQRRLSELLLEMGAFQTHLLSEPRGRVLGVMGVAVSKVVFQFASVSLSLGEIASLRIPSCHTEIAVLPPVLKISYIHL